MSRKKFAEDLLYLNEFEKPTKKQDIKKNENKNLIKFIVPLTFASCAIVGIFTIITIISFKNNTSDDVAQTMNISQTDVHVVYDDALLTSTPNIDTEIIIKPATITFNENTPSASEIHDNSILLNKLRYEYDNNDIFLNFSLLSKDESYIYSFPVLKTANNTFYLDHDINKNFNMTGSIFTDYRMDFSTIPKLLPIYGNNINDDAPLYSINKFLDESFFKENNIIKIETDNLTLFYEIFSFSKINDTFKPEQIEFYSDESFNSYITSIKDNSLYYNDIVKDYDNIIAICTSSNNDKRERYILYGKRIIK